MITKKEVIENHPGYKSLINAVISRVGLDSVSDINNYGIDGGFGGFIYYKDTLKFFNRYKNDIIKLANEQWKDYGYSSMLDMFSKFKCFDRYDISVIADGIYNGRSEYSCQIRNGLAWYAAEEVCRWFDD
jgi:hypothetical protein